MARPHEQKYGMPIQLLLAARRTSTRLHSCCVCLYYGMFPIRHSHRETNKYFEDKNNTVCLCCGYNHILHWFHLLNKQFTAMSSRHAKPCPCHDAMPCHAMPCHCRDMPCHCHPSRYHAMAWHASTFMANLHDGQTVQTHLPHRFNPVRSGSWEMLPGDE